MTDRLLWPLTAPPVRWFRLEGQPDDTAYLTDTAALYQVLKESVFETFAMKPTDYGESPGTTALALAIRLPGLERLQDLMGRHIAKIVHILRRWRPQCVKRGRGGRRKRQRRNARARH